MPLQNRVDPFGHIQAVQERGLLMGNRGGRIHDPATKTLQKRRYASRRWIICTCVYKDWHRDVMGPGYTELFFLDEVTALAAGHRPCAFCRRDAFKQFCQLIACTNSTEVSVEGIDRILHAQRIAPKPVVTDPCLKFPDGTMIAIGDAAYAKNGDDALTWSYSGYVRAVSWADVLAQRPLLITPCATVAVLRQNYAPVWHSSANNARSP